jgi:hypothetical protein
MPFNIYRFNGNIYLYTSLKNCCVDENNILCTQHDATHIIQDMLVQITLSVFCKWLWTEPLNYTSSNHQILKKLQIAVNGIHGISSNLPSKQALGW